MLVTSFEDLIKRKLKIGYFTNFLNEKEGLENHESEMGNIPFDARIYCDGKYPGFPLKDIKSTDGSLDVIKKMKNVHLIQPNKEISEMDKNNLCFQKAAELNLDFIIQCDADEWIEFSREDFIESFSEEWDSNNINTFQFLVRFTNHFSSPPRIVNKLPRLFFKPQVLSCRNIHWWFYALDTRITIDPVLTIEGIHMHHDDRVRSQARNELMNKYQDINIQREKEIQKSLAGATGTIILDHVCDYDPKFHNSMKCTICQGERFK